MNWELVRFEEGTDYDPQRGYYRFKKAVFTVNGDQHTLRISMSDFNADRTQELINAEVQKILNVGSGKTTGRK